MAWTRRVREKKKQSRVLDFRFGQLNGWWYQYLRWERLGENQVWVEIHSLWIKISHCLHWCKADPQGNCCSVTKSCPILCDHMDYSTPGFPALHCLQELAQTHVHWISDGHPTSLILCHPLLLLPSVFPSIRVFPNKSALRMRWLKTGASASASVLPMNIQDWFPLGWTGLISLQSKGLSRVFSSTTVLWIDLNLTCKRQSFFPLNSKFNSLHF